MASKLSCGTRGNPSQSRSDGFDVQRKEGQPSKQGPNFIGLMNVGLLTQTTVGLALFPIALHEYLSNGGLVKG